MAASSSSPRVSRSSESDKQVLIFDNGSIIVESTSQSFFQIRRASIQQRCHHRRVHKSVVLPNPTSWPLLRRSSTAMHCWILPEVPYCGKLFLMRVRIGGGTEQSQRDDIVLVALSLLIAAIAVLTPMSIATALVIIVASGSPLQCWRRPRRRGQFGVVGATFGCRRCTV